MITGRSNISLFRVCVSRRRAVTWRLFVVVILGLLVGCADRDLDAPDLGGFTPAEGYQQEDVKATFYSTGPISSGCYPDESRIFVDGLLSGDLVPHDIVKDNTNPGVSGYTIQVFV